MNPPPLHRLPKRSFVLYLLVLQGLTVAWFGGLRIQQTLTYASLIQALDLGMYLSFLLFSGISYTLLGLSAALAAWLRWKWTPWYYPVAVLLTSLLYWAERTLLTRSAAGSVNWPFAMVMNLFLFFATLVFLAHPKNQLYFHFRLVNPFSRKGNHGKQSGK